MQIKHRMGLALMDDNPAQVQDIIQEMGDVNAPIGGLGGALHMAVAMQASKSFAMLLEVPGVNIEARDMDQGTPLHRVAELDNESMVNALLDKGANIEARDEFGQTPLIVAVRKISLKAAIALIHRGADKDAQDNDGRSVRNHAEIGFAVRDAFMGKLK